MLIKVHFFIQTISKKTLSDLEAIKTKDMDEVEDYGQEVDGEEDDNESEAEEEEDREEDNSQEGIGS